MHVDIGFNSTRFMHLRIDQVAASDKVEYSGPVVDRFLLGGTRTLLTGCVVGTITRMRRFGGL